MSVIIVSIFIVGCGKTPPYPPRTYYGSAEDVIIKEVEINSVKGRISKIINRGERVAVLSFKSPGNTQGGALVSDIFSLMLQQNGVSVVERDHIDKVINEHKLINSDGAALSDLQVANKLGKLVSADYMIFGSVTLYKSEGQVIYLPVNVKQEDRESYMSEYSEYREWYLNSWSWWPFSDSLEKRIKKLRVDDKVLSLSELEEELGKLTKTEFRNIASIGVSAKIVDVSTTKIDWMGQGETVDFTLVRGANRILDKFVISMQTSGNNLIGHGNEENSESLFSPTVDDSSKYLNVASFETSSSAGKAAKKLSESGYEAYVFTTNNNYYAVSIGPFPKVVANSVRDNLIHKKKVRKDTYLTSGGEYVELITKHMPNE